MAPRKRSKTSTSSLVDTQIAAWLLDDVAIERWIRLQDAKIFEESFVRYPDFSPYRIQEAAIESGLDPFLDYKKNNLKINHIMVKLFLANLNLGEPPRNSENCVWTSVCGTQMFFSIDRINHILEARPGRTTLHDVDCNIERRDHISHLFFEDDTLDLRHTSSLRPKARLFHRFMMKSIVPRGGSYHLVYPENFKALYAICGSIQVNWTQLLMDEFLTFNQGKMQHIYYAQYIMRLINRVVTHGPESVTSKVHMFDSRTIKLMKLPDAPPQFITFRQWIDTPREQLRRSSSTPHPSSHTTERLSRQHSIQRPSPGMQTEAAIDLIARNQLALDARLRKIDGRFKKIKGFFANLWDALSCTSEAGASFVTPGKRPAPNFSWSTSDNTSSSTSGTHTQRPGKETAPPEENLRPEFWDDDDDDDQE